MKHFARIDLISDGSIQDTKDFSVKEIERIFDALESYGMELSIAGNKIESRRVFNLKQKVRRLWERLLEEREAV